MCNHMDSPLGEADGHDWWDTYLVKTVESEKLVVTPPRKENLICKTGV